MRNYRVHRGHAINYSRYAKQNKVNRGRKIKSRITWVKISWTSRTCRHLHTGIQSDTEVRLKSFLAFREFRYCPENSLNPEYVHLKSARSGNIFRAAFCRAEKWTRGIRYSRNFLCFLFHEFTWLVMKRGVSWGKKEGSFERRTWKGIKCNLKTRGNNFDMIHGQYNYR